MLDRQILQNTLFYLLEPYYNHFHSLFKSTNKEA